MYYVYILRCGDGSLYTGITTDMNRRLDMHKGLVSGGAKYTRAKGVLGVEAIFEAESRSEALKLEYRIKHMSKQQKERLINGNKDDQR